MDDFLKKEKNLSIDKSQATGQESLEKSEKKNLGRNLNESVKIIIVLGLIALVASTMLAVVNYFTRIDENQQILDEISSVYHSSIESSVDLNTISQYNGTEIKGYFITEDGANIIVSKAKKGEQVCYNAAGITVIVIIKDGILERVVSFSHSETPGLGERALKEEYLEQYEGIDTELFNISEGDSISSIGDSYFQPSSITGATYSSNGVSLAVKAAVRAYRLRG